MKILHIAAYNTLYFNGVYSVLVELTKEQAALGHQVRILNIDNNEGEALPIEQKAGSQQDFRRLLEKYRPDIAVLHGIYKLCYRGYVRSLDRLHIPFLVEPHGGSSASNARKSRLKKLVGRLLIANRLVSHAQAVIYLNQKEADECIFKKVRRQHIIIPNGTVPYPLKPARTADYPVRFIFLARIDIDQKALDLLFPAIKRFNDSGNKEKAEFHFYGKARMPEYAAAFDNFIRQADENVFYHGPAFGEDKLKAYYSADVFVLTSRYEGMPMSVLEALSCGLPCLLTPQTNMADIIEQYHCGWTTQLGVETIAQSIQWVVKEYPDVAEKYTENARKAVAAYSWNHIAQKSIACYQEIIQKFGRLCFYP